MSLKDVTPLLVEGSWYLLLKTQCSVEMQAYPHTSLIWHSCSANYPQLPGGYQGCWRVSHRWLGEPCGACGEICPEAIQGLWKMHNWETKDKI